MMDRLPSDTAERTCWPILSIVPKRVDPPQLNNAHNAHATTEHFLGIEFRSGQARHQKNYCKNPETVTTIARACGV